MRDYHTYPTREEFLQKTRDFYFEDEEDCPRCHSSADKLIEHEEEGLVCEACIGELKTKRGRYEKAQDSNPRTGK